MKTYVLGLEEIEVQIEVIKEGEIETTNIV